MLCAPWRQETVAEAVLGAGVTAGRPPRPAFHSGFTVESL